MKYAFVLAHAGGAGNELRYTTKDAQLMARTLRRLGFVCTVVLNPTAEEFSEEWRNYLKTLKAAGPGCRTVFYFAGHGCCHKHINYLCLGEEKTMIHFEDKIEGPLMAVTQGSYHACVLDCCRAGIDFTPVAVRAMASPMPARRAPMTGSMGQPAYRGGTTCRSWSQSTSASNQENYLWTLFGCKKMEFSHELSNMKGGLFTTVLCQELRQSVGTPIHAIFQAVGKKVMEYGRQGNFIQAPHIYGPSIPWCINESVNGNRGYGSPVDWEDMADEELLRSFLAALDKYESLGYTSSYSRSEDLDDEEDEYYDQFSPTQYTPGAYSEKYAGYDIDEYDFLDQPQKNTVQPVFSPDSYLPQDHYSPQYGSSAAAYSAPQYGASTNRGGNNSYGGNSNSSYADRYSHYSSNSYADRYSHTTSDIYTDRYSHNSSDSYADRYSHNSSDSYADRYSHNSSSNSYSHADRYSHNSKDNHDSSVLSSMFSRLFR